MVLEPTFAAYHLDYSAAASRGNRYNGTNFALPHRDYTFSDSYDTAGRPKVLTIWIPVSEVCLPLPQTQTQTPPPTQTQNPQHTNNHNPTHQKKKKKKKK